jgi:hypothetical protein
MEEINDELLGRLQGYMDWAAEVSWHKHRQDSIKQQIFQTLKKSPSFDKQLFDILVDIHRKQEPLHEQNITVCAEIHDTVHAVKLLFANTHAELFAANALVAAAQVRDSSTMVHDYVAKQSRLVKATSAETCSDFLPQILFLQNKEQLESAKLKSAVKNMASASHAVLVHVKKNYFVRLKKLACDEQYHHDHNNIFVAVYALGMCSKIPLALAGLSHPKLESAHQSFADAVIGKNERTVYLRR